MINFFLFFLIAVNVFMVCTAAKYVLNHGKRVSVSIYHNDENTYSYYTLWYGIRDINKFLLVNEEDFNQLKVKHNIYKAHFKSIWLYHQKDTFFVLLKGNTMNENRYDFIIDTWFKMSKSQYNYLNNQLPVKSLKNCTVLVRIFD